MTTLHPNLLYFLLLGLIPVLLHLLLKAKPKKLIFPALFLIRNRQKQNVQRMRLKHFWLMLLRVLVVVSLVVAVARPRIPPANYWPTTTEWFTLGIIAGTCLTLWFWFTARWKRQRLAPFLAQHKRTLLRAYIVGGAIVATLLFFVWPFQQRVFAQIQDPHPVVQDNVPVASVLIFDTSSSMQYRHSGQTRLETAREIALEHLKRLPSGSRVAIADTSNSNPINFLPDQTAISSRLSAMEVKPLTIPINERLRTALELQKEDQGKILAEAGEVSETEKQDSFLREIVVFSDMGPAGWQVNETNLLKSELEKESNVALFLIDVSVPSPVNTSLTDLRMAESVITAGSELRVQAMVNSTARDLSQVTVDLSLPGDTGKLVRKSSQSVELRGTDGTIAQLTAGGLSGNVVQGELRLKNNDPLDFDNVLYFTVEIQPPQEVLVVSDTAADAQFWSKALAPTGMEKLGRAKYRCTQVGPTRLATLDLRKYSGVCLINVRSLPEATWKKLADYVEEGGGVAVGLGKVVDMVSYDQPAAQSFLPGQLQGHVVLNPPEFIDLNNKLDHPLLRKFADWGAQDITTIEIRHIWRVKPVLGGSVIAWYTYANKSPAILERVHGKGRTVMVTTAVSRSASGDSGDEWNDLPTRWSFLAFADQTMKYLSRQSQGNFHYICGEDAVIRLDSQNPVRDYLLRKPNSQQLPGENSPAKSTLLIRKVDQLGHYRFLDATPGSSFERGFSVNPSPRESLLTPISTTQLDDILGKDRYSLGKTFDQLEKRGLGGRPIGIEVFPFLIFLLWLVFTGEHLAANRFYETELKPT